MNKTFLAFGVGLAVGIGGTYFYLKQKYEEKLSEQIQEIRRHYQSKQTEKDNVKSVEESGENWAKGIKNFGASMSKETASERDFVHYESIAKKYRRTEEPDPAEKESPPEDDDEEEIFTVYEEEMVIYNNFDIIDLTYYAEDDILCDDQDQVIEDPEAIIGDALTKFGVKSGYPDTVYVINKRVRAIFEVLVVEGSYQELVLGMKHEK